MLQTDTLRSALPLVLFAVFAGGAAWACFGERGILANKSLAHEVLARQAQVVEREETIAYLRSEIDQMHTDRRAQERWIRQELGYVKDGELLYLFPGDRAADFAFVRDREILAPTATP